MTTAFAEHLKAGRLLEALTALQATVRQSPEEPGLRLSLFEVYSVLGQWEKARKQLEVLGELDSNSGAFAKAYHLVVDAELTRSAVFAGKRTPPLYGEPEPWMEMLVQANQLSATHQEQKASELVDQALSEAAPVAGSINGQTVEWVMDADSRLGPMIEAFLAGQYYWVPINRIHAVRMEAPAQLRDLIWVSSQFEFTNGSVAAGIIPARYPGAELWQDTALQMARKTEWSEKAPNFFMGAGQRMFVTSGLEFALLDVREINMETTDIQPAQEAEVQ